MPSFPASGKVTASITARMLSHAHFESFTFHTFSKSPLCTLYTERIFCVKDWLESDPSRHYKKANVDDA